MFLELGIDSHSLKNYFHGLGVVGCAYSPALGRWGQEDEAFKVILSYLRNWKLSWATVTFSQNKQTKGEQNQILSTP